MPNFSSLARLEVPEKFLWWWVVVGVAKSFSCQTQLLLRLGWGFDNIFVINIEFMIGNDLSNYVNYLAAGWSSYRLAS